jgi:Aspartyl/Asparaginyl beta-hydroxylase
MQRELHGDIIYVMEHFKLVSDGVPVKGLKKLLKEHPELWNTIPYRKISPGTPHSQMTDIWVRYNDLKPFLEKGNLTGLNDPHVPIWYPCYELLAPEIRPIIADLMWQVNGEMLGGVLITKIPPRLGIDKHVDTGWHVDYFDKYYLTISGDPEANFWCEVNGEKEFIAPKEGEIWFFDNHKLHWVENNSNKDRITLIICIRRLQ